jgi:hypothetical protein
MQRERLQQRGDGRVSEKQNGKTAMCCAFSPKMLSKLVPAASKPLQPR